MFFLAILRKSFDEKFKSWIGVCFQFVLYVKNSKKSFSTGEWSERANFTKSYLKSILQLNEIRCRNISSKVDSLNGKVADIFQAIFPWDNPASLTAMRMLKKVEDHVFHLLDLIQDCSLKVRSGHYVEYKSIFHFHYLI